MNIKLTIEYEGTRYAGWQIQKNAVTIQGKIEQALYSIYLKRIRVLGAGRTDAGVHAKAQNAHLKISSDKLAVKDIPRAVNAHLPDDIRIKSAQQVNENFHAQFCAKSKIYRYIILNDRIASVFDRNFYTHVPYPLDTRLMRKEIVCLKGKHDFKAFQAVDKKQRTSVRRIMNVSLKKKQKYLIFEIEADGFLYNMVRNIAGTMLEIGRGKFASGSMKKILESRDRSTAGPTAPAKGLCLVEVKY